MHVNSILTVTSRCHMLVTFLEFVLALSQDSASKSKFMDVLIPH